MKITTAAKADRHFRLYRKCLSTSSSIQSSLAYHEKNSPQQVMPGHRQKAQHAIDELTQFATRLVSIELNSHTPAVPDLLKEPTRATLARIFDGLRTPGPAQLDPMEMAVIDLMTETGRDQRAQAHQTLLACEIALRAKQGWFMVFNTLTVENGQFNAVFNPESTAFATYIRKVNYLSARSAHGSVRNAKGKDHHSYFACVEEGAQNGRLHVHVLHFFSTLPKGSRDPNTARSLPTKRELSTLKGLWPYGFSSPIMVRYSPSDAFGRAGYRWPYDVRTDQPYLVKSPLALAGYMSKYITKSYTSPKRNTHLWRIRKTHGLGRPILRELLSTLTPAQLLHVASSPSLNCRLNNQMIPHHLLALTALQTYQSTRGSNASILTLAKNTTPLPSPLRSLRASTRAIQTLNQPSSTPTSISTTKDEALYDQSAIALASAAQRINSRYFGFSTSPPGTDSIRDLGIPTNRAAL